MTVTILCVIAAIVGYIVGRTHGVGGYHRGAMPHWRDHCIAAAITAKDEANEACFTWKHPALRKSDEQAQPCS